MTCFGCRTVPFGGLVLAGWDVSATPNGTIVLVFWAVGARRWRGLHLVWLSVTCQTCSPSWDLRCVVPGDRAAVLKAVVEFTASKVGQDLDPRKLSALTVASVALDVIAKKRAEIAVARPGENAPQAIIVSRLPCVRRPTRKV